MRENGDIPEIIEQLPDPAAIVRAIVYGLKTGCDKEEQDNRIPDHR